ncbi:MAG: recombinase family protein [Elusimicrobiales bacterium]|nr:recombinase family protein [Elusimicrobiales bacterium]
MAILTGKASAEKKRYVIYTRCSTDDQAQGDFTTLDAQAHHCRNMLEAFGHELACFGNKGVVNDDGYSGKDLNRPGMQSILTAVNGKREFDGIIFFRLDRLTRNPRDLYAMIDLFRDKNIDFVSVRENLDSSTAIGRVVIGILGLLSAFERELTGERVKASALARVRQGRWVGGGIPYGYDLINDGPALSNGHQPHKLVVNEELAAKLRPIWDLAAQNKSLTEIGNILLSKGIKSPTGKLWLRQSISNIIKNPFYKGYVQYGEELHKGLHQGIVEPAVWEKANRYLTAKLPGHRFWSKRPKNYEYRLSGLIRCGKCGSHYICVSCTGNTGKQFFYYVCGRGKQGLGCKPEAISATAFDNAVIEYFRKASADREILIKAIGDAMLESQIKLDKADKRIQEEETKLEAAKAESKKLLALAMDGDIPKGAAFKDKFADLEAKIAEGEEKLEKLHAQRKASQLSANSGQFLHDRIRFGLEHLDSVPPEAQKDLMRALIQEIVVHDGKIELKMYIEGPQTATLARETPIPAEDAPINAETPRILGEALTAKGQISSGCKAWLSGQYDR